MKGETFMEALKYKLEDGELNSVADLLSLFIFNFIYFIFVISKWLFSKKNWHIKSNDISFVHPIFAGLPQNIFLNWNVSLLIYNPFENYNNSKQMPITSQLTGKTLPKKK